MIHLYLWVVLWVWDIVRHPPAELINEAKKEAQIYFQNGEYERAADYYKQVVEASVFSDPAGRMNMANAYFLAGQYERAYENYMILSRVEEPQLAAMAKSQLGMIALEKNDTITALAKLREAILLDRSNRNVVTGFEVLRSRFSGEVEVGDAVKTKAAESSEASVESVSVPELTSREMADLSDHREQLLQNLDKINMSEEQAKSVLDAMKVNERQYIYQLRRLEARSFVKPRAKVEW